MSFCALNNDPKWRLTHFKVLDSWRGVSACFVVLLHFMANSHFYDLPVISSAGFFVDFFFVLSGFVIFANYEERLKQGFGFLKFMILRFGRLYPLHFATFSAFIAVELLQIIFPQLNGLAKFPPFTNVAESGSDIVSHLFLFHALDFQPVKGFNSPSWSISAEFYTYIVFAIALIIFKNRVYLFCLSMLLLMNVILVLIYTVHKDYLFFEGFFRCLSGFSAGALCWMFWRRYEERIHAASLSRWAWSAFEVAVMLAGYLIIEHTTQTPYKYVCVFLFSAAVLVFAFEGGYVSKVLKTKIFSLLGVLSYSIYMNHVFIASKVIPVLGKMVEDKIGIDVFVMIDGREKIGITKWHGDAISIIYLLTVVGVSLITYKLIEEPFRNLFRSIAYKKKQL